MPYTIPSSVISPGAVYQPRQIPAVISQNARALYYTRGGSASGSLLLDQSPLNSGTRRTGEEGRYYTADGIDDEVNFGNIGSAIWFSGWVKLNSDNQCLLSLSNDTNTNLIVSAGVLTAGATLTLTGIKVDDVSKTASEAGALLNDNAWHFLSCGIGDGLGGASTADDVRFFTDGTAHGSVSGFDWRFWSTTPTAAELTEAYSGESPNRNIADLSKYALWAKCDEQSGTTAYDSSGNGNNGTLTNITAGTFHATQDIWSFQNQVGFNTSGAVYIPRDESDPTNDVLGNPLTNTGRRPNDAALHSSNCLTADGTLYIAAAHLTGSETVVISGGTSTPSISAGRIDFTAGTCWDLTLSDGTHYPLSEGGGIGIHDDSGSGNHGILTNAVLANAWGGVQDSYHKNLSDGFVYAYQPAKQVFTAAQAANITGISFKFRSTDTNLIIFSNNTPSLYLIYCYIGSAATAWTNGMSGMTLAIDGSTEWGTTLGDLYNALCDGGIHEVVLTNLSFASSWVTDGIFVNRYTGTQQWDSTTYLWDLQATDSNGDPIYPADPDVRLPAVTSSLGPYSIPLTDLPSDPYHNRAETLIDFDPDSTPEMGATQLGITVPSSHAFGDAFTASDQIFSRQRSKTEDRFLVFPEAQTGSALATIQKYTQP